MSDKKYDILILESGDYSTVFNRMYRNRKPWHPVDPGHLLAFMPGTAGPINVKAGEKVRKGDVLMVFRAMKMDNNILAPFDGKVKRINVKTGDNLPKDFLMMEME